MRNTISKPLSTVATTVPSLRTTRQTLQTLQFIHRFRHVTTTHIQTSLRHAIIHNTNQYLTRLRAKGYIARQYDITDKAANRAASYFLTEQGLKLLQAKQPFGNYRRVRSIKADATIGLRQRERYHTLADAYTHFKRHYEGQFEFFTTHDIAGLEYMPTEAPDGYVRTNIRGSKTQHYFIEIYGWHRSTQLQQRRLQSYLRFFESEAWQNLIGESPPNLFIVLSSQRAQAYQHAQLASMLEQSLLSNVHVYTTTITKLNSAKSAIWQQVQY